MMSGTAQLTGEDVDSQRVPSVALCMWRGFVAHVTRKGFKEGGTGVTRGTSAVVCP